jgi:sorbitol-specific phosphotransferase system component IIC
MKTDERTEAFMRILVGIISGLILGIWKALVQILAIVNWFIAIITAKRNKDLANFCEMWNTQVYIFLRYMTFVSNKRPFPFSPLEKSLSKFER